MSRRAASYVKKCPHVDMDWKPTDFMLLRNELVARIAATKQPSE